MTNKPVHEIRYGTVRVAIWERELDRGGIAHSIRPDNSYRDKEEEWQTTQYFSPSEAADLALALQDARRWCNNRRQAHRTQARG